MMDILEVVFMFSVKKNMVGCRVLYQKENIPEVGVKAEVFCRHPEMLSNGC